MLDVAGCGWIICQPMMKGYPQNKKRVNNTSNKIIQWCAGVSVESLKRLPTCLRTRRRIPSWRGSCTRTRISSQVQDQSGYRCPGRPSGVQSPSAKKTTNFFIQFAFLSFQSGPKLKQRCHHSSFCSERPTRRMSSTT